MGGHPMFVSSDIRLVSLRAQKLESICNPCHLHHLCPHPRQVTFDLHSSFANPRRDIEFQPYELTEVGWGEFDIIIRVRFLSF